MPETTTTTPSAGFTDPLLGKQTGQESSLSSWAGPYVTDMLGQGQALAAQPYQAYTGPLTAGYTDAQNNAFSGIAGLTMPTGIGEAGQTAGQVASAAGGLNYDPTTFTTGMFDSNAAQQYMNPYIENALEPQIAEARRQAEIDRVNNAGRMTRAGAFGGSRQAIMEAENSRNMLRNVADITGTGYNQAYDRAQTAFTQDQARQLQTDSATEQSRQFGAGYGLDALRGRLAAAQTQGQLGTNELGANMDLYSRQASLGGMERSIEQSALDAARGQFNQEQVHPYQQVQFMQSLLQGMPLGTQSITYQQPSGLGSLLGTQGGIMELLGGLFGGGNPPPNPDAEGGGLNTDLINSILAGA